MNHMLYMIHVDATEAFLNLILHFFQKEKAPYEAKAAKKKAEYDKVLRAYNKKQVNSYSMPLFIRYYLCGIYSFNGAFLCLTNRKAQGMRVIRRSLRGQNLKPMIMKVEVDRYSTEDFYTI